MIEMCTCKYCGTETTKESELDICIYNDKNQLIEENDVCEICQVIKSFEVFIFKKDGKIL